MRIIGFEIERFGVWRDYAQCVHPQGLTVFYGPNEAGKTTLLRFIRGVLYGFTSAAETPPANRGTFQRHRSTRVQSQSGRLHVTHRGREYEIVRSSRGDDAGLVTIHGAEPGQTTSELLHELTSGTDERLFESVFAVGLPELQEFATLTEEEVARHLYGMTLGPQGQLLMELPRQLVQEMEELWPSAGGRGLLADLHDQWRSSQQQTQQLSQQRERYRAVVRQRREAESQLASLRKHQQELQRELRLLGFLEKVHPVWNRARELRRELSVIPDLKHFPADGLNRLDRLQADRDAALKIRDELLKESRELSQRMKGCLGSDHIRRFAGSIRALQEERQQWSELRPRMEELECLASEHDRALQQQLATIGSDWTISRLENLQETPEAHARFITAVHDYQRVCHRVRMEQRRYRRARRSCRQRQEALQQMAVQLGVTSAENKRYIEAAHQRILVLSEVARCQVAAQQLEERAHACQQQLQQLEEAAGLPDWVWLVFLFFVLGGLSLTVLAVTTGASIGWFTGMIYLTLGITAAAVMWGLHWEHQRFIQQQVALLREHRLNLDRERLNLQERMQKLADEHGLWQGPPGDRRPLDATQPTLLAEAAQRLLEIELWMDRYTRLMQRRKQLSQWRSHLQGSLRELAAARKTWCETLKQLGFDETAHVAVALAQWQQVAAAREIRHRGRETRRELSGLREDWERFCRKVEDLARRLQDQQFDREQPLMALARWEHDLHQWIVGRQEYRRLSKERRLRRQEAEEYQRRVDQFQQQIAALLQQAQATDRDDLERKLQLHQRRQQLELLLQQAQRDLEALTQTDPELALTEDDLLRYRPQDHQERQRRCQRELSDIERQLQDGFEKLGTLKQELKTLTADRTGCRLRFEQQQRREQLQQTWHRWFTAAISAEILELVSAIFEQSHQPEMLSAALPFVQKLTCGRYHRLWTQLGCRRLFVDDALGNTYQAEQLSGGTREQLFLAIRFAMVRSFARQGIELPMVLDDVAVNFDQERSEAAVETLLEFVQDGQQVLLFTSHLHFAQMFQRRGIEFIPLPQRTSHHTGQENRLAG
ncbi:MAG: hypothetical protein KatS3mg113_0369 [Planctomycetaceae bacterium]|nr:MAG: hypothetical protein KatS3mg113_0369 [Planctomycetaceae bacterium]